MHNKHKLYSIIIMFCYFTSISQNKSYESLILGKWVGAKKETKNGNDKLLNGKPNKEFGIYEFKPKNVVVDYTFNPNIMEYSYLIKGNILILGKLSFKIEKITKHELILIDYKEKDPNNPLVFRHYFIKE